MKYLKILFTISILGFLATTVPGCNTVAVRGYNRGLGYGPPPLAPAPGYRQMYQGYDLQFDSGLGAYIVLRMPGVYFINGSYYRYSNGGWYHSNRPDRDWRAYGKRNPPGRLYKIREDRDRRDREMDRRNRNNDRGRDENQGRNNDRARDEYRGNNNDRRRVEDQGRDNNRGRDENQGRDNNRGRDENQGRNNDRSRDENRGDNNDRRRVEDQGRDNNRGRDENQSRNNDRSRNEYRGSNNDRGRDENRNRDNRNLGYRQPPRAPASGYRQRYQGHNLQFNSNLGAYVVLGMAGVYFIDGSYFRHTNSGWYYSNQPDRGWRAYGNRNPPGKLYKIREDKNKRDMNRGRYRN